MSEDPSDPRLTPREEEVLRLMVEGHTYWEITNMLHLGSRTVRMHVDNIKKKLYLRPRSELVRWYATERRAADTVRLIQIAAILGVTHQQASVIVRQTGFPAPVGRQGQGRLWSRREVTAWAKKWQRKNRGGEPDPDGRSTGH